jgi:hypothetical protein
MALHLCALLRSLGLDASMRNLCLHQAKPQGSTETRTIQTLLQRRAALHAEMPSTTSATTVQGLPQQGRRASNLQPSHV